MKKYFIWMCVLAVMAFWEPAAVKAEMSMGVSVSNRGEGSLYVSIGEYNRIGEREVVEVKQLGISDEELPVVFFIASKANVPYQSITQLRLKRWSWMRIIGKYKLDPAMFYVPVNGEVKGRVYGRSYGFYSGRPQKNWRKIKLSDGDVINFVNLRFISEYYGQTPEEIIQMRESGSNFSEINRQMYQKKMHGKKPPKEMRGKGNRR